MDQPSRGIQLPSNCMLMQLQRMRVISTPPVPTILATMDSG
jgi:hypothetical protein